MYSAAVALNILQISIRSIFYIVWLKSNVSLLSFLLEHLSNAESRVFKFSTIIALRSIFLSLIPIYIYGISECSSDEGLNNYNHYKLLLN